MSFISMAAHNPPNPEWMPKLVIKFLKYPPTDQRPMIQTYENVYFN